MERCFLTALTPAFLRLFSPGVLIAYFCPHVGRFSSPPGRSERSSALRARRARGAVREAEGGRSRRAARPRLRREKPPLAPRVGWRLPRRPRAPRHSHYAHRVQQQPPFPGDRPPRAQALLPAPAGPGAEGPSGSGDKAGGDGRTNVSSRPTPRLRARTLPQRRPAWRGWWHRRLGRCGGLLRGGGRAGRLPPHGPGGQRRRWGPPVRGWPKYAVLGPCSPAAAPVRALPAASGLPGSALGAPESPAVCTHRPWQGLPFSRVILVVVEVVGITHPPFPHLLGIVQPVEVLASVPQLRVHHLSPAPQGCWRACPCGM